MPYALLGFGIVVVVVGSVRTWLAHRGVVALRRETGGEEITFQLRLDHVKAVGRSGSSSLRGAMTLIVRTDTFEVSAITTPFRAFLGMDYYFRARDTTIEVSEYPSFVQKMDWIVVRGQQGGMRAELAIASENYLYDAWVALVRAGAVPLGPPPPIMPGMSRS